MPDQDDDSVTSQITASYNYDPAQIDDQGDGQ